MNSVIGKKFDRWTVVSEAGRNGYSRIVFCICCCVKKTTRHVRYQSLRNGTSRSCGCLQKEAAAKQGKKNKKHGMVYTKEYNTWANMVQRCHNKKTIAYKWYGGRGISVCKKWRKFDGFFNDMGHRPKGKTLDRKNNSGNYNKKNCRWVDITTQARNKRTSAFVVFNGRRMCLADWGDVTGINRATIAARIKRYHWPIKDALEILNINPGVRHKNKRRHSNK